jgi:iron complex transport system permease protein
MPGSDNVLPINSVTALIGIPVVIWVILRDQKYRDIF